MRNTAFHTHMLYESFDVNAVSLAHVNNSQTETRDLSRKVLQGSTHVLQTKIEHVIWAILSPIIFDFVLFYKNCSFP